MDILHKPRAIRKGSTVVSLPKRRISSFSLLPGLGPEGGNTECIFTLEQALRRNEAWKRFLENPGPIVIGSVQMDMGDTAAFMKAKPVLPPRKESELKAGVRYKWMKAGFEKYYLWKLKHGFTQLP